MSEIGKMSEDPSPISRKNIVSKFLKNTSLTWQWTLSKFRASPSQSARNILQTILNDNADITDDLTRQERLLLNNILVLNKTRVDDVMIPRADIAGLDINTPLSEALLAYKEAGHSRFMIYRETLDDPIGLIHIKDIMGYMASQDDAIASEEHMGYKSNSMFGHVDFSTPVGKLQLTRSLLYVPPSMPAHDLLIQMQTSRKHLAVVIDEYGGTDGIISIEDLLEIVVGEIEDEHDIEEKPQLTIIDADCVIADARLEISDLVEHFNNRFAVGNDADDVDTLGGLIFSILGRIPTKGESVLYSNYELEVLDVDVRRIKKIKVSSIKSKKSERRLQKQAKKHSSISEMTLSEKKAISSHNEIDQEHDEDTNIIEMPIHDRPSVANE